MIRIILASNNMGKIKEIESIFGLEDYSFLTMKEAGFPHDITEGCISFEENALKKAFCVSKVIKEIIIADDSGLEIDILGAKPGVLSARYSGKRASDKKNNEKVLWELNGIPEEKRGAQFRCLTAIVFPNGKSFTTEGICRGKIAFKETGDRGFGYDPIFIPEGYDKTFAQLPESTKNMISHRYFALLKMKKIIKNFYRQGV